MSVPFYVSPEQLMRDRADFARKGIAKGRSAIALQYADGILFVAENRSPALHKVAEIYDRMAFAAVGRYNEFENLRIAGVRLADMRGYSYDRRDVTGRALANAYAQTLGAIFSSGGEKPLEVEILVAEIGASAADDQIYRLTYDGSIADVRGYAVMGGPAEQVADYVGEHYQEGISLAGALRLAVDALGHDSNEVRELTPDQIEVAVLDRTRTQVRKFKRISEETLARILSESSPDTTPTEPAADKADTSPDATDDTPVAPAEDDVPVAPPEEPDDNRPL
ncbi:MULTISPECIES: proteasome subunit alpha [unclassified Kribbella]|uniref:proteasome subunit alpha n=1 Tax=unclassified Kribbella TaxID=2644121 RepID=UPI0030189450